MAVTQARGVASNLPGPLDPAVPHDYTRVRLALYDGGLNTAKESEQIAPNELVAVSNLLWYDGQLLVDTGTFTFSAPLPFGDQPHVPYQVFYPNGTQQFILLSTNTLYVLAGGNNPQWQYVDWGGPCTLTAAAVATGATSITVTNGSALFIGANVNVRLINGTQWNTTLTGGGGSTWTTSAAPAPGANAQSAVSVVLPAKTLTAAVAQGSSTLVLSNSDFVFVGSPMGVLLPNGQQWQFEVTSLSGVSGTTVGTSTPCPAGGAPAGSEVALPIALHGSVATQPIFSTFPALGWVVISNGVDPLFYFYNNRAVQLPGLPDGTTCYAMNVFHESLHIGSTVEGGTAFPQRLRMSDATDPTGWTPGQNGIAAEYNLDDTEDFILSLNLLGPWLIVYRETTIMRGTYLGLPLNTMYWEYMVYGEGIQSQGSVSEIGETHLIVGTQGVYEYAGGYDLTSIGDNIFYQFLSAKGDLNAEAKSTLFTQYISDQDEAWILYASGSSPTPNAMLRCSLEKHAWYPRKFPQNFLSAGIYLPLETIEWINAVGTWAENTAAWNSRIFLQNQPNVILCAAGLPQTAIYDYKTRGDQGVPVSWSMTPKAFGDGDSKSRWDTLVLYGRGNGITLSMCVDPLGDPLSDTPPNFVPVTDRNGAPFVLNFGVGKRRQLVTFNGQVGTYVLFQLSGADPTFSLEYVELWYSFESEY